MHFLAAISIAGLIHVLIQLLVLVLIGWIILWILAQIGAPAIARKLVLVIGGLIAILILLSLIYGRTPAFFSAIHIDRTAPLGVF